eukprot:4702936-Amphidinium_carterae.1
MTREGMLWSRVGLRRGATRLLTMIASGSMVCMVDPRELLVNTEVYLESQRPDPPDGPPLPDTELDGDHAARPKA